MRILSITAQKPHSTGSGTYLTELVRSWAAAGHEQAVVCGIYPDDTIDFPEGVSCYPVFFKDTAITGNASADSLFAPCKADAAGKASPRLKCGLPYPIVGMSDVMPYTSTRYCDLNPKMISMFESSFISAVQRAVADLDPDLILCHHLFLLTAMVRKHFPDRRVCGLSHGSDLRQAVSCPDLRELVRPGIEGLDHIFALNDVQAQRIIDLYGVPSERISVIGTGYNSRLFNADDRIARAETAAETVGSVPVTISYAGKMSAAKGVPEFLEVLDSLSSDPEVPEFKVTLAGGCQEEPVRIQLDNAPGYIEWVGQIPQPDLAGLFRTSDIFVLPSFYEGLPLVLIEAMASGAVPVCTDLPGVRPWISANVPDNNIRFIPMPEMASVDEPTEAGRKAFISDMLRILKDLIIETGTGSLDNKLPDTVSVTWDAVANRILN